MPRGQGCTPTFTSSLTLKTGDIPPSIHGDAATGAVFHEARRMSHEKAATGDAAMDAAGDLPQLDATSLVDTTELEDRVKAMYRQVAEETNAQLHFETGRRLAESLGYPREVLDRIPAEAIESFAGVGYHFDLASIGEDDRVLDLGSGSGTDVFFAAQQAGERGSATGVDFTPEQVRKALRLRDAGGITRVEFVEAPIDDLPFEDDSFDVVISNGVINLSPVKALVFSEAARVLRRGGRLALADIVSGRPLKGRTRRNTELWAACIAGAIPRDNYASAIEQTGLSVDVIRQNDYRFISDRALNACSTYGVESISLLAHKTP
jgi:SAM-dependent methyltransferase